MVEADYVVLGRTYIYEGQFTINAVGQQDLTGEEYCAEASFIQLLHIALLAEPTAMDLFFLGSQWTDKLYENTDLFRNYRGREFKNIQEFRTIIKFSPNKLMKLIVDNVKINLEGGAEFHSQFNACRGDALGEGGSGQHAIYYNTDNLIHTIRRMIAKFQPIYAFLHGYGTHVGHSVVIVGYEESLKGEENQKSGFIISDSARGRGHGRFVRIKDDYFINIFRGGNFLIQGRRTY